jgi:outer membrane protein OmpA-like peptidoglycan-associated protein
MNFGKLTGYVSRLGAVIVVAAALGGCSMMPDWLGGDSDTAATADSTTPAPDQSADANAAYPDLADTPNRPTAPSTPDDQKQVADSLGAAQARQDYNTEQLRAGAETAAAPPPAEAPKDDIAEINPDAKAGPDASSDTSTASAAAPAPATTDTASSTADNTAAAPAPAPTTAVASAAAPALSGAPSGPPAVPAVPPVGSSVVGAQAMQMTDTQLGFQPSKAPPLDASVAQFVPQPVLSRYRETAAVSSAPAFGGGPAVPAVPVAPYNGAAVGGPEMSGAVVANFDSLQGGAVAPGIAAASGGPATASILFPHDTTILSGAAKAEVLSAAQAFNTQGGAGYIRIVGHASSRSANMSVSRHLQWDFDHSQARATSVARALIAAGVPADKVLVNAVGDDNQSDEENSRRADIFFQN